MIDLAAGGRRRIVYVTTRKRTEDLASLLTWQGTRAEAYHGAPLAVDDVDLDQLAASESIPVDMGPADLFGAGGGLGVVCISVIPTATVSSFGRPRRALPFA